MRDRDLDIDGCDRWIIYYMDGMDINFDIFRLYMVYTMIYECV